MDFAQRAARNEEVFRSINDQIEAGAELHDVATPLPYHCECGSASCFEMIHLNPAEYARVARERYRFAVVPGHEKAELERVVEVHDRYLVVEKIGEAREQLDHDHPQGRHRPSGE